MADKKTKERLLKIRETEKEISRLIEERDSLRGSLLPGAIQYDTESVQTTPQDKLPDIVMQIVEIEGDIRRLQEYIDPEEERLLRATKGMREPEKTILRHWTLGGESLYKIAKHLGKDYNYVKYKHRNAIRLIAGRSEKKERMI